MPVYHCCGRDGERIFDATLSFHRREVTWVNLAKALALHPPMGFKAIPAIYYRAIRLYLPKRDPFFAHP